MSFRKIQTVTLSTNSEKNLVLRQQFALKLIELLKNGKRIINVDQTWLGMADFRRIKWSRKDQTCSVPKIAMLPRITMFLALDNDGDVYLSLLQSNSNNKVMEIYLRKLVLKLDQEDAEWRSNTVLLLDNAPYHTSEGTIDLMSGLQVPVLFTGPYSYDAAPIELFFAAFKSQDINPRHVPQGKR